MAADAVPRRRQGGGDGAATATEAGPRRLSATSQTVRNERTCREDGGHLQQPNPRRENGRNGPSRRQTAAATGCTDREDEDGGGGGGDGRIRDGRQHDGRLEGRRRAADGAATGGEDGGGSGADEEGYRRDRETRRRRTGGDGNRREKNGYAALCCCCDSIYVMGLGLDLPPLTTHHDELTTRGQRSMTN
ncbi:hypothetical protein PAHAL_2G068500 [Panicum hallii]|uniref:Uncharacterized protein n=1 Tax=Panicum hallii TaxID=206008 RepID=A0A2T8KN47_9POAL|nr:hypothetical protein PAHAL_2G068500 [Panicum hallii]